MRKHVIGFVLLGSAVVSTPASASITGNVNATITLTTACQINNVVVADATNNVAFGTLDFGPQNSYFTQATAQLVSGVGNGIAIQCSNGTQPTITFSAGNSAGLGTSNTGTTGTRSMKHTTSANYVTYNLYRDTGGTTPIVANTPITLAADGSAQTVTVYGTAYGAAGLVTGTYNDVVVVTIAFGP
ncbi:MAG: spore coat protein U domain-containing protein [Novosphingobium sp.]